ncbi:acyl transferase [Chryseosolibacter indicus]|uniref:Acyl transferase n=1 Tax=Chryseosolibacter indicus TaxID=2782351 RepID=A0ABS5VQS0_9BACT|nr:acyl transferase [Chryseosolibacter indicus]MBT1703496.1 acyl transferase [Chryseosolibacter indicus]
MDTFESFRAELYDHNDLAFENIALTLFRFQASSNTIYKAYIDNLGVSVNQITSVNEIPFMPISFFKNHTIKTGTWNDAAIFTSSGTTGSTTSIHHIQDLDFYLNHAEQCFIKAFGELSDYHFLALLPSYLERSNSSLVAMLQHFIKKSASPYSGFYLHDKEKLLRDINTLKTDSRKTILWGVTFALLDLAEHEQPDLSNCLIFETGGMKGRRKEITRQELHKTLRNGLNANKIYSEYGMTELLSQAYSDGSERFYCNPWIRIIGREITDPFHKGILDQTSAINVVDLANVHSIAFIETEDLGKVYEDGSFEILGRMDNSDVRGCNLMVG